MALKIGKAKAKELLLAAIERRGGGAPRRIAPTEEGVRRARDEQAKWRKYVFETLRTVYATSDEADAWQARYSRPVISLGGVSPAMRAEWILEDDERDISHLEGLVETLDLVAARMPIASDAETKGLAEKQMKTKTRSVLFLDVSGWSKLNSTEISAYVTRALPGIASRFGDAEFKNTWGDAIVATFESARTAAKVALAVRDHFRTSTPSEGIAKGLQCRIALHQGEVMEMSNPFLNAPDIFGHAVHIAARLEAVGKPGHVVCTEQFAAALHDVRDEAPKAVRPFDVELPKDAGHRKAFFVLHPNEPEESVGNP